MSRLMYLLAFLAAACFAVAAFASTTGALIAHQEPPSIETQLIRVIDGDTVAVKPTDVLRATNDDGTEHVVRLLGVDAPEMNKMSDLPPECGAEEATARLQELVSGVATITLQYDRGSDRTDRYERSLAYVELADGTDLGLSVIESGYAEAWYPSGEPEPERFARYEAAQQTAMASDVGAHASCDSIGR